METSKPLIVCIFKKKSSNVADIVKLHLESVCIEYSRIPNSVLNEVKTFFLEKKIRATAKRNADMEKDTLAIKTCTDDIFLVKPTTIAHYKVALQKALKDHTRHRTLMTHQKRAVKEFSEKNPSVFMLYWSMGSGKTLAALSMVSHYQKILIVCSNTMIGYWCGEIQKETLLIPQTKRQEFLVLGYTEFRKHGAENVRHFDVVIVDEAHQYRNLSPAMEQDVISLLKSKKLILLTGTPIQNDVEEMKGILKLLRLSGKESVETAETILLKQKSVFYYNPLDFEKNAVFYPTVTYETQTVPMDIIQTAEYLLSLRKKTRLGDCELQTPRQNSYDSLTRAISNTLEDASFLSPKFKLITDNITSNILDKPHVVYSHYRSKGVEKLFSSLPKHLKTLLITGNTPARERDEYIARYNENKIDVLFITDAAREGIDLHNTGTLHIVEPHVNAFSENQTIARVVRHNSHRQKENKRVKIIKYLSVFPKITSKDDKILQKYIVKHYEIDCKSLSKDFQRIMRSENMKTVDERYESNNLQKAKQIKPWLEMLQTVGKRKL